MTVSFPQWIDPWLLADKRRIFRGSLPLAGMSRLEGALLGSQDEVEFELMFSTEERQAAVTGFVAANLVLACQLCLEPMNFQVRNAVRLRVVSTLDEANRLPDSYEPLLVGDERIAFRDIIEDELLLALPIIPRHPRCNVDACTASPSNAIHRPSVRGCDSRPAVAGAQDERLR